MNKHVTKTILAPLLLLLCTNATLAQVQRTAEWYLNQFDQKFKFAEELLSINPNPTLTNLMQQAKGLRNDAADIFLKGQRQLALNKLNAANRLLDQILQTALRNPLKRMRDRLNQLLEKADRIVLGSGNMEADRLLQESKNQRSKGVSAVLQKRYQAGIEHYRVATYLAQRAIDLVEGPGRNLLDRVEREREQYLELLTKAGEIVNRSGNPLAKKVYEQAVRQGFAIRNAVNQKDYALALDLYYRSTRLLLRAINIAEGQQFSPEEQAREELARIDDLLISLENRNSAELDVTSKTLLRNAKDLRANAQNHYNAGRYQRTIQSLELAEGVIRRLTRRMGSAPEDVSTRVESELERLQNELHSAGQRWRDTPQVEVFLAEADKVADQAATALQRGFNVLAVELILAGHKLIRAGERASGESEEIELASLRNRFAQLDEVLEETDAMLSKESSESYLVLDQAKIMRANAYEALERDNYPLADALIKIATDLARKSKEKFN